MIKEFFSLLKYQFFNVIRAKWLMAYGIFFFCFISALLMFGGSSEKASASMLSIILFIIPMISILYASIYWYNSELFTSLLLTQPLRRANVFLSNWFSISMGLVISFTLSTSLSLLFNDSLNINSLLVILFGGILSFIFVGIGLLVSVLIKDRMKGIGLAFLIWLYFAILHDIVVFFMIFEFKDYPIEIPTLALMASNPIDLVRVEVLLHLNLSAMMGYTGKILQQFLSSALGFTTTFAALLLWIVVPVVIGLRIFSKQDLN